MKNFLNTENEFRFNELLFENRNKNYGAYVMRNNEANVLTKSLLIGVAIFGTLAISPLIINSFRSPTILESDSGGLIYTPVELPPDEVPVVVAPIVPPKIIENTVKLEIPTPTRDAKKETPATPLSAINNAKIGTETIAGSPVVVNSPPIIVDQNIKSVPAPTKPVNNNPVTIVDVEAAFSGGINAFRTKVVNNFNAENFEGTGELIKTTVTFIVEKDGTISSITAKGPDSKFNKEAENTIKNIKGKWMPAKLNGETVRSYFNFPISMQFD